MTDTPHLLSPSNRLLWVTRWLLFAALCVSGYLLYHTLSGGGALAGCSAQTVFDCESVINSHWSKVGEIPASALAIASYIVLLGSLSLIRGLNPRVAGLIAGILSVSILGAAIWFSVLQFVILKKICIWCMSAHVLGSLGSLAVLWMAPKRTRVMSLIGIMPVVAMLSMQLSVKDVTHRVEQITTTQTPIKIGRKQVLLMGNRVAIDPALHPLMGSADAKEFLMYLFDYTCPHCRALHGSLEVAVKRYGGQLAIIALPMPLNSDCNPLVEKNEPRHKDACTLAMLSLVVFKTHPDRFTEFDRWLIQNVADAKTATAKAIEILGSQQALDQAMTDPWIGKELDHAIMLYKLSGEGVIPKLIGKNTLIAGRPGDVQDLYDLLEDEMGLMPLN
ncbi:MAG: thioredoxin domain-containing protein [Phycisphaeraceae bacterium]|nr:thioredoxin domain-containing protein [Phycisphaeraceae bacterium]